MDCYSKQFLLALSSFFSSLVPAGAEKLAGTVGVGNIPGILVFFNVFN
jgi:hypothetical protein